MTFGSSDPMQNTSVDFSAAFDHTISKKCADIRAITQPLVSTCCCYSTEGTSRKEAYVILHFSGLSAGAAAGGSTHIQTL